MWQYLSFTLRRRGRSVLVMGGFLFAACALIVLSATTQTTALRTQQIIAQNWRPAYDLVVLPPQAKLPPGEAVPAGLLEGYDGGITVSQYEQIKRIAGVAVAAPLAFLGYVQLPPPTLQFSPNPLPPGYYKLDLMLTAFNGQKKIVERRESKIYYFAPTCQALNRRHSPIPALHSQGVVVGGCGFGNNPEVLSFLSIDTGTFLLAAIDPTAENQLVHLDKSITQGRMLTEQDTVHPDEQTPSLPLAGPGHGQVVNVPVYNVPILLHQQLPGQITLQATLTYLASDALDPQQALERGGFTYLSNLPGQQQFYQGTVPLVQNDPKRIANATLIYSGGSWRIQNNEGGLLIFNFLYTPSDLTYRQGAAPDGQTNLAYTLVPSSTQSPSAALSKLHEPVGNTNVPSDQAGPEVAFRALRPLQVAALPQPPYVSALYNMKPVGQFTATTLSAQFDNLLNWLPENTYVSPPVILRYNAQGRAVTPTPLLPTTNPAGYIPQPPLALTTLAAARKIVGDNLISAIRVRVAGVSAPNEASWRRIQQVAQEIAQRTGLRVFVTLGSSPQPTLVYVPGIKKGQYGSTRDIAPLGWVEERWISIGAGIVYLTQLGETRNLLLGAVLLVCLGYLVVTFSAFVAAQRHELAILSALGWRPWQPPWLFLSQVLALSLAGGIAGIGLALLLIALIGAEPPWVIVAWTLPMVLGLALLSALSPLWQIWRIRPAEILRAGTSVSSGAASRLGASVWWVLPAIVAMALRNLARSRVRILIALGCLFCSAALLTVMVDGLLAFRQTLQGTLLGNYVLLQTAVPQLAGALFAVLLTFSSVADLLLLQVRERQQEIGVLRAVGWRPGIVRRLFIHEGVTLAILGAVPGVLVAMGVLAIQHQVQAAVPAPLVGIGAVLLMSIVAVLAALPAIHTANRMQVVDALRAE